MNQASKDQDSGERCSTGATARPPHPPSEGATDADLRAYRAAREQILMGREWLLVRTSRLLALAGLDPSAIALRPPELAREIGARLDVIGIAFEPDNRYGPIELAADGAALLFRFSSGCPVDPMRPPYRAARSQIETAVRDGLIPISRLFPYFEPIGVSPEVLAELASDERLRLHAFSIAMTSQAQSQA